VDELGPKRHGWIERTERVLNQRKLAESVADVCRLALLVFLEFHQLDTSVTVSLSIPAPADLGNEKLAVRPLPRIDARQIEFMPFLLVFSACPKRWCPAFRLPLRQTR
jgi:hypothetical protein